MSDLVLELQNVEKQFEEGVKVLQGISLQVERGEFLTFLGASGCGKTTTLRIIAGLERADSGRVFLDGQDVTDLEPNRRDVNTVFQNYALFPHMTVAENIGYGLKLKKVPKSEIRRKVSEMLELVQLPGYEKRRPDQLSGGQRQRVAIARALVNEPKVLLLDEPLGALDANLRRAMQTELKRLQKKLGITFLYITHDQEEAINMSDRIAVMREGRFEQIGTPDEIYYRPRTSYVAAFVGNANVLEGEVLRKQGDLAEVRCCGGTAEITCLGYPVEIGERVRFAIRGENVELTAPDGGMTACVREKAFAGGQLRLTLDASDESVLTVSRFGIDADVREGENLSFRWDPSYAVLIDRQSGEKGAGKPHEDEE